MGCQKKSASVSQKCYCLTINFEILYSSPFNTKHVSTFLEGLQIHSFRAVLQYFLQNQPSTHIKQCTVDFLIEIVMDLNEVSRRVGKNLHKPFFTGNLRYY
jgi:hypothetical protein